MYQEKVEVKNESVINNNNGNKSMTDNQKWQQTLTRMSTNRRREQQEFKRQQTLKDWTTMNSLQMHPRRCNKMIS